MLIFSKLKGGYWPNCELVAEKCYNTVMDDAQGRDCSAHLAGNSPYKAANSSTAKKRGVSKSPMKIKAEPTPFHHEDTSVSPRPGQGLRQPAA